MVDKEFIVFVGEKKKEEVVVLVEEQKFVEVLFFGIYFEIFFVEFDKQVKVDFFFVVIGVVNFILLLVGELVFSVVRVEVIDSYVILDKELYEKFDCIFGIEIEFFLVISIMIFEFSLLIVGVNDVIINIVGFDFIIVIFVVQVFLEGKVFEIVKYS